MGKNKKVTPIKEEQAVAETPRQLTVMVMGGFLLVQPNFDVPAGTVLQVLPQSGTQLVENKTQKAAAAQVEVKEDIE